MYFYLNLLTETQSELLLSLSSQCGVVCQYVDYLWFLLHKSTVTSTTRQCDESQSSGLVSLEAFRIRTVMVAHRFSVRDVAKDLRPSCMFEDLVMYII